MGEALGLSIIHVNRTLQKLWQTHYVRFDGGRPEILHWHALARLANFDSTYLHLDDEAAERHARRILLHTALPWSQEPNKLLRGPFGPGNGMPYHLISSTSLPTA